MTKKNKKADLVGVVLQDFVVGTDKPKKYKKGDSFSTGNQQVYQGLINNKKIK
jgi:hypothetical protein